MGISNRMESAASATRYAFRIVRGVADSRLLGKYRPMLVNIEPTHRCNLSCFYCDKAIPGGVRMDTDKAVRLIDELADLGTISVCFDGGEPLVHPGMGAIARRAKERGLRVAMSTNGVLFRKKAEVLEFVDVIKISIDGPPAIHDYGRGAGMYERAMDGARYAVGLGKQVSLRMTLASHNLGHHAHVIQAAQSIGAQAIFQPAIESIMNRAGAGPDVVEPSAESSAESAAESSRTLVQNVPTGALAASSSRRRRAKPEEYRGLFRSGFCTPDPAEGVRGRLGVVLDQRPSSAFPILPGSPARPSAHSPEVLAYRAAIDDIMRRKSAGEAVGNEWVSLEHIRQWPEPTAVPACSAGRIEVAIGPEGGMYPCGRYGRQRKAPNVFELGAARAFEEVMRPTDCRDCWCALTVSGCYLHGADLRMLNRWR